MADAPGTDFVVVPASEGAVAHEHVSPPLPPLDTEPRATIATRTTGSLSRRMILIAAGWILLLLTGGGFALDRVLTAGRYVIPFWQFTEDRIAHVAAMKYPDHVPLYGDGPNYMPEVWWIDPTQ